MSAKKLSRKRIIVLGMALLLVLNSILGSVLVAKSQPLFDWRKYVEETAVYAARFTQESNEYMEDGRLERAWKYLQTRIGTPKTYEDYELFASIAIAREEFDEAIGYLQGCIDTAHEVDADPALLRLRLASLHVLNGQRDEALSELDEVVEADPTLSVAYYLRGQLAAEAGDTKAAMKDFRSYAKLPDADPYALSTLGNFFENDGDLETAVACYSAGMETPAGPTQELCLARGRCLGMLGDSKGARKDLEQYFELTDNDPEGQASAMLAICMMEDGELPEAIRYFEQSIENGYTDPTLLHFWIGVSSLAQNEYDKALEHFTEVKEQKADYADIDYYLGVSALATESFETADDFFTDSIEKGESVSLSYYNRALCHIQAEQFDEAKEDLQQVVERGDDAGLTEQAQELMKAF